MKRIERTGSIDFQEFLDPGANIFFCFLKLRRIRRRPFSHLTGEIIWERVRQNEVTVNQTLHQRAGSEAVGAVIGKICFTDNKQTRHVAHQVVIDPKPAHRVVDGRINPHRHLVGIFTGDLFVNFEQVSVALANHIFAQAFDRVGKIQIHAASARPNATTLVANFLRCA